MNLDADRVIRIVFSLKYELLYKMGLDGISACFLFLHFESVPKCTLSIYT